MEGREKGEGRRRSSREVGGRGEEGRGEANSLSPHCLSPSDACPWLHSPRGLPNPPQGVESGVDPHVTGGRWEAEREPGDNAQASGFVTRWTVRAGASRGRAGFQGSKRGVRFCTCWNQAHAGLQAEPPSQLEDSPRRSESLQDFLLYL